MLRRERERCGLTQKQAAEQAGMNLSTLQYIEVGRQVPSLDTLLRLLDVYGVTMTFEREENDA
jgi:transcriptional regulator with XRE-family HTH domain